MNKHNFSYFKAPIKKHPYKNITISDVAKVIKGNFKKLINKSLQMQTKQEFKVPNLTMLHFSGTFTKKRH